MPLTPIGAARYTLQRIRRPEFTGANRCVPCTVVNLGIAAAIASALWHLSSTAALAFTAVAVTAIGLRGYLVPRTPALTKRFLPDPVLAWFDHGRSDRRGTTDGALFDVLDVLSRAGVLVDGADDVVLEPQLERRLVGRVDELDRTNVTDEVASLLGVSPESVTLSSSDDVSIVRVDGRWAGQWESGAALLTDLAAHRELAEVVPRWDDLSLPQRSKLLEGLRACLTRCPVCRGAVVLAPEVVESCRQPIDVVAATCEGCDARLFELDWNLDAAMR